MRNTQLQSEMDTLNKELQIKKRIPKLQNEANLNQEQRNSQEDSRVV